MSVSPGSFWVRTEYDRTGRAWQMEVRIEVLPGCAADVPAGYRLSIVTYPVDGEPGAGHEVSTVRITGRSTWPTWDAAAQAAEHLVNRLRAGQAPAPTRI